MARRTYALADGGAKDLELLWEGNYQKMVVRYQGTEVGNIPTSRELLEGRTFEISGGKKLEIRLVTGFLSKDLYLSVDGQPLPESPGSSQSQLKESFWTLVIVSALSVVLGVVAILSGMQQLVRSGMGWESVISGGILALLVLAAGLRQGWAYLAAGLVFLAASVWSVYALLTQNLSPNLGSVLIRLLILWTLWKGWLASQKKITG